MVDEDNDDDDEEPEAGPSSKTLVATILYHIVLAMPGKAVWLTARALMI